MGDDIKKSPDDSSTQVKYRRILPRGPIGLVRLKPALAELATVDCWRDVMAETVNTFSYLFLTSLAGVPFPGSTADPVRAGLTTAFTVFGLIETFGHVQGAHFNPAVTLCFALTKRISIPKGFLYVGAQCAGAAAASALVYHCAPEELRPLINPLQLGPGVSPLKGMVVEWGISVNFMFTVIGTLDAQNKGNIHMMGLPIGVQVGTGIMAGAYFTGGCMNPVIWFGPASATGKWENGWVYWVGPLLGSLTVTLLYSFFVYRGRPFQPRETVVKEDSDSTNGEHPVRGTQI